MIKERLYQEVGNEQFQIEISMFIKNFRWNYAIINGQVQDKIMVASVPMDFAYYSTQVQMDVWLTICLK